MAQSEKLTDQIAELYIEAFRWYQPRTKPAPVHVTFYPYIGINHTIRLRNGEIFVRICEICREMPLPCQKGLAYILVGKLLRRKIPDGANEVYNAYVKSDFISNKASENKKEHGRKVVTTSKGSVYDLEEIFAAVNARYFGNALPKPMLTWSAKKTYRILGHHDATHNHITISASLDSRETPQFVVEYVVFHEMLHMAHPTKHINGRRYHHTPEFRRDEQKFAHYEKAERWIEGNVRRLKRNAKKR
ncbi:MAG: SprT-like domain-containing protein [Chloracidobacterium sp.]|nr:SprT-like domain-containing protein [Chloracidobacterium sp.]